MPAKGSVPGAVFGPWLRKAAAAAASVLNASGGAHRRRRDDGGCPGWDRPGPTPASPRHDYGAGVAILTGEVDGTIDATTTDAGSVPSLRTSPPTSGGKTA